jgi:hypothetical protein
MLGETPLPPWQEGLRSYMAQLRDNGALDTEHAL